MNRRRSLSTRRYSSVPCLTIFENDTTPLISLPTSPTPTPTDGTSKFFIADWPSHTPARQEELNRAALDPFHTETDYQLAVDSSQDLLGRSIDEHTYILKIFDPITRSNNQPLLPPIETADEIKSNTLSINHPIKLRLKLSVCPEMKPFYEFVQHIRNDYQSKDTDTDELFYCKRVQRLTSQHIEQNQLPVTILIYRNHLKDPIRLPKVSLQSTVSHILYQLLELISFDYDQSILKLRSREEYLRHDDTLCDIEYVHKCINSLKPLQFILTDRPQTIFNQKQKELLSFEHFCFVQYEKYIQTNKQSLRISNKRQTMTSNEQTHWFMPTESRWLEDFHQNLSPLFEQIQRCFNQLFRLNISLDEQIQFIDELTSYLKTVQTFCSNIRSNTMLNQHRELKNFKANLLKTTENIIQIRNMNDILIETLHVLEKYIQSYCQAFLIPYKLEIIDQNNQIIFKQLSIEPRLITNSLELFTIQIDSLFSLPTNMKNVRVLARLCYGNQTVATELTRSVSCIRNKYQQGVSEIRLNERLLFNDIYLCNLQHESLILFEIYASFIDDNDSSLINEIFDGETMYLVGWCSQNLFDSNDYLITGEYYFGIVEAKNAIRTGFYSLRNISDHECSVLTVSFCEKKFLWPHIQARHDRQAQDFTEINRNKQEDLCRLLDQQRLYLIDHSTMKFTQCSTRQQIITSTIIDNKKEHFSFSDNEYAGNEGHFLWSHRYFLIHKPYALPKLFQSRPVWDYPSLIDIYGLFDLTIHDRTIDEIEAFELLLPAFPDMYIRSKTYRLLISQLTTDDLMIYLPQLIQMVKFDYLFSSPLVEHLLKESIHNHNFAHKFYWYLRQALLTENIHFYRYFYLFLSLLYVIGENLRNEFENEYFLCLKLRQIGLEIKTTKSNRLNLLTDHLKTLNQQYFQSGQYSCRLPCQFSFQTNQIDIQSCSIFNSLTLPMKLVFQPYDPFGEKFYSIYKIGDDLRQDQIVLQLLSCMDKIWQANDWNFRLSLFNVVQTYERCGFVEMITESETLMEIEKPLGAIKGSFGESALYDWLRLQNTNERDFQKAIENLTYSCAGYCVGTYVLGIGDRHNENIMVKKSGHLFHIDFGKYLGDTQKFGWFNRDRSPLIFTKQMLYAMSDGGTSNDAMHRFVDLCCNAFYTLRQNSSLLLLLLSHLCSSNVPNLNYDAVRYVNDRLALSLNYAESITHFTNLIVDSLNSTWVQWNGLIHKLAQTTSSNASLPIMAIGPTLSFIPQTYTIHTEGRIHSAQIVNYEKRTQPSKHYLYKIQVERINSTYHYRTHGEFYEFSDRLKKQFPLMGFDLKFSQQFEDKILAQRHVSDINDFLTNLFRSSNEVIESDLVCTFFHLIQRDQQINDSLENPHQELGPRPSQDSSPKIRIQLKYDQSTLFIMVRHATNLPSKNGNEPKPYCKCYLFPDKSKSTKRKGKFANSRNPIFNDTFTYEMDLSEIQKRVLRVSVWNNIISVGNRILGEVDIVLSQIDWSKENACDYTLATLDSSTFFSI